MRRSVFTALVLLIALRAPAPARAQATTPPPPRRRRSRPRRHSRPRSAGRRAGRRPSRAQPVRADRPRALHRRPREQHRRRSGALSALPGRPRRAALLRLPLCVRAARRRLRLRRARRTMSAGAIRSTSPTTTASGSCRSPGATSRSRSSTAWTRRRPIRAPAARWCSTTRRSAPPRAERASAPTSRIAPQFELRERRDIGRVDVVATPTPNARHDGQLHDAEARRRAAVRRQLRLQQRRRGAAALRLARQRLHHRHRVDEHEEHAARRLQRIVVRQPRAHAGLGQPAAPRRHRRHARHAAACRCGRPTPRRRSASAATPSWRTRRRSPASSPTACGATTSRCSRSRSIRRWRRFALPRANTGGRSPRLLDEPEPDVAPHDRLAVRRALPQLHLLQSDAGDEHHDSTSTTTRARVDDAHGRSGSLRPRPDHLRRPTRPGAG